MIFVSEVAVGCGKGEWKYSCLVNGAQFVMMEHIAVKLELSVVSLDTTHTVCHQIKNCSLILNISLD